MPFCVKCGRELPEGASFCPDCGASVTPKVAAPVEKVKEGDIGASIKALNDEDLSARMAAAKALVRIGPGAMEPLIGILRNKELPLETRKAAAYALGNMGDKRAVPPLMEIYNDRSVHLGLWREVKQSLQRLGVRSVYRPADRLVEWVGRNKGRYVSVEFSHKPTHGREAGKAEGSGELLGLLPGPRQAFVKVRGMGYTVFYPQRMSYCEEIPDGIVFFDEFVQRETVIHILSPSEDQIIEQQVLAEFYKLERELDPEFSRYLRYLSWGHWTLRGGVVAREAIEKLKLTRDMRVIRLLILGLVEDFPTRYDDRDVARGNYKISAGVVLTELCKAYPKQVQDNMLEALRSKHDSLRWKVASLLANTDIIEEGYPPLVRYFDESALLPIIKVFKREVERSTTVPRADFTAYSLAKALGEMGDARAVDPLMKAIKDGAGAVRAAAKEALKKIKARVKSSPP